MNAWMLVLEERRGRDLEDGMSKAQTGQWCEQRGQKGKQEPDQAEPHERFWSID